MRPPRACLVSIGILAACTHGTPPPRGPTASVRTEIAEAEAAEQARHHDAARTHYQRAIEAAHDPESIAFARHEFAETLVTWGEEPSARAQLEIAATANPADASVWHDLGLLRHSAGDDPGAILALARAIELVPHDPRPRTALAALYWKRGDKADATREYRGLLALELPDRVRAKIEWALAELAKP